MRLPSVGRMSLWAICTVLAFLEVAVSGVGGRRLAG